MDMEVKKPRLDWKDGGVSAIVEMGLFLARMKKNFNRADLAKMTRIDFNIDESTAAKLINIASHPILSNPEYADQLPSGWGTLYEMKFLPDDILLHGIKNGHFKYISKYDVWTLRGVKLGNKKRPLSTQGAGGRITAAPGQSLVQYIREGIKGLPDALSEAIVAERCETLNVSVQTFRMLRRMIILSDRPELTQDDKKFVLDLLDKVDRTRNIREYYQKAKPLMDRIWGGDRRPISNKSSKKRVEVFRNAIVILRDTCDRVIEMDMPYMSEEDVDRSINDLVEARRQIAKLAETLRRSKND